MLVSPLVELVVQRPRNGFFLGVLVEVSAFYRRSVVLPRLGPHKIVGCWLRGLLGRGPDLVCCC